jgi:hypothetical protein
MAASIRTTPYRAAGHAPGMVPHPGGDHRDEGKEEQEPEIGPEDRPVDRLAGLEQVVVVGPVDADVDEARQIRGEDRDHRPERLDVAPVRDL